MRVFVTGVSGYLGSACARRLLADDAVELVAGIDIREPGFSSPRLRFYRRDVREPVEDLLRELAVDTVVHMAYVLPPMHDQKLMEDININGTLNIMRSCREAGVKYLLYTSSTTAYGFHPDNDVPLTEESPLRGHDDFTYSKNKKELELLFQNFIRENPSMTVSILRPCFVVGPGFTNPLARYLRKKFVILPLETRPFQYVHEDDLVDIISLFLRERRGGVYNVAGDGVMPFEDMLRVLGNRLIRLPAGLLLALNSVAWKLRLRFLSEFPSPALNMVRYSWVASNEKLKRETGYRFKYTTRRAFEDFAGRG